MRILEINAYYDYGSTGHIVKDLCEEGKKTGYDMYAIYWLRRQVSEESSHVVYCGEDKIPSIIVNAAYWTIAGGQLNYNTDRTKRIIEQIKRIKPDIIHLHNLHGDFEYGSIDVEMFFNALSEYGCKIIWTFHDCWPITGRCYYFEYRQCQKWKTGCGKCPQKIYDREGVLLDKSADNLKRKNILYENISDMTIVTVSYWLEGIVKESILKNREIVTIQNGIDSEIFRVNDEITEHNGILCIGWDRRKGFNDYFKIAQRLPDESFYILGKRPFFRKHIKLLPNMHEIPYTTSIKEMAQLYNSMKVYFNASVAETFGLTTAEAIACGLPVVGYDSTATPEIISYDSGVCVHRNDIDAVVSAIKKLIHEDNQKKREKRSEYARAKFNKKNMIDSYMKTFCSQ